MEDIIDGVIEGIGEVIVEGVTALVGLADSSSSSDKEEETDIERKNKN